MRATDDTQAQRLLLLLLLTVCSSALAQFSIETIEGSDRKELQPRTVAKDSQPKEAQEFNCIVCDDIRDAHCQPWDQFSHSRNCYTDPRINKNLPVGCRKMVQQVEGLVYVSRQCTNLIDDSVQGCVNRVGTKKIKVTYCHCRDRQNCNAAAGLGSHRGLLLLLLPLMLPTVAAAAQL